MASGFTYAEIAVAPQALPLGGTKSSLLPVAAGNIFAADENFAIFGEPKFTARENFADRAFRGAKRVIQADQRCCLRHAIALNNGITHALEKVLGFIRKRCATGNESPKLPAKAAVDAAKHPGALEKFPAFCVFKSAVQPLRFALAFEFPLNSCMKKIKHARNGDERGGAFLLGGANDFGGIAGWFENDCGSEERRNEQRHELAEYMAQRNERDEAQ